MDFFDILLAKKLKNDKDVSIVQLNVSENGTYSESGKAYSPVVVDVQPPSNSYLRTPIDFYPTTAEQLPIPKCDVEIVNQKSCKVFVSNKPFVNDKVPYLFRKSAGGDRVYEKLIGGTLAWNQLVQSADTSCTVPNIHKYIARISGTWSIGTSDGTAITVDGSTGDMVFDITQTFGSTIADYIYSLEQATAGAGVAWFRTLFPNDYYAYDSGSLQSVNMASKRVVGFNQIDESQIVNGSLNTTTGEVQTNANRNVTGFIEINPDWNYYMNYIPSGNIGVFVFLYDANKNYIGYNGTSLKNSQFTPKDLTNGLSGGDSFENARYIRFRIDSANYSVGDACLNISNASKNGTYEPYEEHTYEFDTDVTLRGIPKLDANNNLYYDGDTYESDGTVTRKYGIVDFDGSNDENWTTRTTGSGYTLFEHPLQNCNIPSSTTQVGLCNEFPWNNNLSDDNSYRIQAQTLSVRKDGLTLAQFKTFLEGNPLQILYPLATPTTESADAYINPQIVDADGTEEFVDYAYSQSTRDVAVPVGHDSLYYNGQLYQTDFAQATTDTINMAELHSIVPPTGEFYITSNGTLSVDVWKK